MGLVYTYGITESLKSGIDFYIGISNASSSISSTSSVTALAIKIAFASANIDITSNVFAGKVIHNVTSEINSTSSVLIRQPIVFNSSGPDSGLIRTLIYIDGKPITNHNRVLSQNIGLSVIDNTNWNAKRGRYYKRVTSSGREQFNISWRFLPGQREKSVDQGYARDFLANLASDPDIHVLKIINQDESGSTPYTEETYNVFIRSYDENLIRRDLSDGVYYFDCQLTLEEA